MANTVMRAVVGASLVFLAALSLSGCHWEKAGDGDALASNPDPIGRWTINGLTKLPIVESNVSDTAFLKTDPKSFGIYQWDKQRSYGEGLDLEINHLGAPPSYALYFIDREMGFPSEIVTYNAERNIRTIVTQELMDYSEGWNASVLDSIQKGAWDGYFRMFARQARASGALIYYRFGYEMNGDWVGWGEKPEAFKLAWRRAWRIFREEKASNVRWVFSPNVLWDDKTFADDILPYYPGDTFVDIVGLDGYNFGDRHSRFHRWRGYEDVFGKSLRGMKAHFPAKPLWITEIGCAEGEGKPAWISDFLARFNSDPDLRVFIWFNEDKQYAGEPNWRLDSEPASLATFRDWAINHNSITTFALPSGDLEPAYSPRSEGI